ncbi:hypothetical protein PybrP1_005021 [[Pythium] brassicae (nom. inval.)]|nr:hypothetical protein PybrP1_005021 [[Pythium] brassicae (nom. inval.)]
MLAPAVLTGIAAGASVFVATIVAVFFLLQHGGSFDRMRSEAAGLPDHAGEQKPLLYDALLATARALPMRPAPLPDSAGLRGERVMLRDFQGIADADALFRISNGEPHDGVYRGLQFDADEMIWAHLAHGPFATARAFAALYCEQQAPDARHYVLATLGDEPIGMLTLSNHAPRDLRVQIDSLWLTPAFQGTGALVEAALLLLTHLFESVGYRRVEWCCDGHNVRARRAAHALGFAFEGVLRKHRIVKDCNRDTVVFAAINSAWPAMKEQLEMKRRRAAQAAAQDSRAIAREANEELKKKRER